MYDGPLLPAEKNRQRERRGGGKREGEKSRGQGRLFHSGKGRSNSFRRRHKQEEASHQAANAIVLISSWCWRFRFERPHCC